MPVGVGVTDDPIRFTEAIRDLLRRVAIRPEVWDAMMASAREAYFKVAGISQLSVLQDVLESLQVSVANGTSFADFKKEVRPALEAQWKGTVKNPPARIETIFRTNVQTAYNRGAHAQRTDPAVVEARPFWQFRATDDDRTSEICEPLDGVILPANDPFWADHTPPLHYNCRSQIVTLDPEEVAEEVANGTGREEAPAVAPQEGFGRAPETDLSDPASADVSKWDEGLRARAETYG